jgi:hypothetical protein
MSRPFSAWTFVLALLVSGRYLWMLLGIVIAAYAEKQALAKVFFLGHRSGVIPRIVSVWESRLGRLSG